MERRYRYLLLDVFTKKQLEGNPLAVFPDAEGLSANEMQRIAGELNLSETVFLTPPRTRGALAKARIFTPRRELDFAGHPTVGAAYVLARERDPGGEFAIEENVGLIPIARDRDEEGDERFWLTTPPLRFFQTVEAALAARLLSLSVDDLAHGVPPQFVSAGSPLLFVALASPEAVDRAEIVPAHLDDTGGDVDSVGTFVFARKEPGSSCFDVYSRMFAPQTGILEDPATGGATGPLAGYMLERGLLPRGRSLQFRSEQGRKMGRPSILHVRMGEDGTPIEVGGSVVSLAEGTMLMHQHDVQ